jgi:flagellar basal body-associated protein FliL
MDLLIASILAIVLFIIGTVIVYHPVFAGDDEDKTKTDEEKKQIHELPFP